MCHAPKSMGDRAYGRAKFLDERTKMMQESANYLDKVAWSHTVLESKNI